MGRSGAGRPVVDVARNRARACHRARQGAGWNCRGSGRADALHRRSDRSGRMISTQDLGTELNDLGQAIGLVDGSGNLNTHWFENPLTELESVFSDPTQRAGLLNFLDALLPP